MPNQRWPLNANEITHPHGFLGHTGGGGLGAGTSLSGADVELIDEGNETTLRYKAGRGPKLAEKLLNWELG